MGVVVESRADAHSTSCLARWFFVGTRAGVTPGGMRCLTRTARAFRSPQTTDLAGERGLPVLDRADTVPSGDESGGRGNDRGEVGLTRRGGSDQSPGGAGVPRRLVREGGGGGGSSVLILGLLLLLLGYLIGVGILQTLGIILLVIGAVLWILGAMGRPVGGRRHYW
jgi:hypothetical protein